MEEVLVEPKIKTGWIIEMKKRSPHFRLGPTPRFYSGDAEHSDGYTSNVLAEANVFPSRQVARILATSHEIVRKVSVDDNGKAIEIIAGR
jgi:hypothetical protein